MLRDFLDFVAIKQLHDNKEDVNEVSVMTIHASKGLEFRIVFFIGFDEGVLPMASRQVEDEDGNLLTSNDRLDEGMRLAYVGMTRAKERLYIHSTRTRYIHGEVKHFAPSRFLKLINPEFYEKREM